MATLNVPATGNLVTPMGTLGVSSSTAALGTELRVHQLTSVPLGAPAQWESNGGWWVVDAYASATQNAPPALWSGTWDMEALVNDVPWDEPEQLAGVELHKRASNGEGAWEVLMVAELMESPTSVTAEGDFELEGQWVWVKDYCTVDSAEVTLCPDESYNWMGNVIDSAGEHWHHEEVADGCDVIQRFNATLASVPALMWNSEVGAATTMLSVGAEWQVQGWTFNGTPVSGSNANSLEVVLDGNYGVVAMHAATGCLMSYEALLGCPGDIDGDLAVGVSDVLAYLSSFGCAVDCGVADLNGDGAANTSDLLMMLSLFGTVCN